MKESQPRKGPIRLASGGGFTGCGHPKDVNPNMSSAVVHNGLLTIRGLTDDVGETVESQTQNILNTIDYLLAQGGSDKSKLISATIWLKNIQNDFEAMNSVWVKWIDANNKPVRACTEAFLSSPNLLVEIQVTAAVRDDDDT